MSRWCLQPVDPFGEAERKGSEPPSAAAMGRAPGSEEQVRRSLWSQSMSRREKTEKVGVGGDGNRRRVRSVEREEKEREKARERD